MMADQSNPPSQFNRLMSAYQPSLFNRPQKNHHWSNPTTVQNEVIVNYEILFKMCMCWSAFYCCFQRTMWGPVHSWPGNEERECPPRTRPSSPGFWTPAVSKRIGALSSQHLRPFSWHSFGQPSAPSSPSHLVAEKSCPLGIHWKMGPPSASAITHKVKQNMKTRRRLNRKWRQSISRNTRHL